MVREMVQKRESFDPFVAAALEGHVAAVVEGTVSNRLVLVDLDNQDSKLAHRTAVVLMGMSTLIVVYRKIPLAEHFQCKSSRQHQEVRCWPTKDTCSEHVSG